RRIVMTTPNFLLTTFSDPVWTAVADTVAKATVLLAAAGVASFFLRRASAASRHLIWTLALVGALVLPALSRALPRWQVPFITLSAPMASLSQLSFTATAPAGSAVDAPAARPPALPRHPQSAVEASSSPEPTRRAASPLSPSGLLVAVWMLGASVILARL